MRRSLRYLLAALMLWMAADITLDVVSEHLFVFSWRWPVEVGAHVAGIGGLGFLAWRLIRSPRL